MKTCNLPTDNDLYFRLMICHIVYPTRELDAYDKLLPYEFSISGCIDG